MHLVATSTSCDGGGHAPMPPLSTPLYTVLLVCGCHYLSIVEWWNVFSLNHLGMS